MGFFARLATNVAAATVERSLPNVSDEKLVRHYNAIVEAYRMTDDDKAQGRLFRLQQAIEAEITRRGLVLTDA